MSPRLRLPIRSSSRRAFTLVELLIAMAIFVILATLAISGYRVAYDADRVGDAASVVRGGIEGARSRAIKSKEVRGLRLLLDPQDNRIATSIVYVGEPEVIEGYCRVEFDNEQDGTEVSSHRKWRVFPAFDKDGNTPEITWRSLYQRGLLRARCRIEINGKPLQVYSRSEVGGRDIYDLGGPNEKLYRDDAWTLSENQQTGISLFTEQIITDGSPPEGMAGGVRPSTGYIEAKEIDVSVGEGGSPIGLPHAVATILLKYKLHLLPAVLEGASPVALPANTCIDLDGSLVPSTWRPGSTNRAYGPLVQGTNEVLPIDILFTPRGNVSRDLIGEAFLIFRIANRNDLEAARANISGFPSTGPSPTIIQNPEYSARLVTLVTQTGMLRISPVSGELPGELISGSLNSQSVTGKEPFRDAILGREAVQ